MKNIQNALCLGVLVLALSGCEGNKCEKYNTDSSPTAQVSKSQSKYVDAVVTKVSETYTERHGIASGGFFFGKATPYTEKEGHYMLNIKADDGNIYVANVVKRQGGNSAYFIALKEAIEEGTRIQVERKALNRFAGVSGLLVNDEIKILGR